MSKMCRSLKKWTSKLCTMYNYPHPSLLPFPWVRWGVNWTDDLFSANSPLTFYKNINAKLIAGGFQPTHWCLDQSEFFKIFTVRSQTPVLKKRQRNDTSQANTLRHQRPENCVTIIHDCSRSCFPVSGVAFGFSNQPTGFYRMRIIWFPAFLERTKCFSHSLTFWV